MIELHQVSKSFNVNGKTVEAVKNVSITVEKGEIFGVVGYSGAGKSTLVRCINLLERPDAGQVVIDGKNLSTLSSKELRVARRKIGMIFQGYNLLKTATVYDNIAKPLKLEGVPKNEIETRVNKYLSIVGLEDKRNNYPSQLSGGQKQRVAIARALAHEPEILLSDEATSALDPETTEAILQLLLKINAELGITIFLITHELDVIQRICDRVAVMENGHLVEQGTVLDILKRNTRQPSVLLGRKLVLTFRKICLKNMLRLGNWFLFILLGTKRMNLRSLLYHANSTFFQVF
ncbi:Methionine import ATP-binding protein MetN 1 [Listeria monocytogenes N53-1]|nr:Methionine import ATP-binding protein MetN 1 [Listeria monocytogenes]CCQ22733.1 Methionine import ATP-binding protein MetN 1 [Listeria monocytogenes N53-1]